MAARAQHVGVTHFVLTYAGACHCPRPIGPDGLDSTVDFFAKSAYAMMTAPVAIRPIPALVPRDLSAGEGIWVDTRGRRIAPGDPFRPGLYFRKLRR